MALWSGRFDQETDEELKKFTESISYDKRLYRYDIAGSCAHVNMLAAQGIVPEKTAGAIVGELKRIEQRIADGDFTFTAELEDIHMHIEHELIKALGDEGARLHSARSRNDQVALDIRLYLRDEIDAIADMLRNLQKTIVDLANKYRTAILPGFTHLQHAQPVLFAHHLLAYVEMFNRDFTRLQDCRQRFNVMPLGSSALAGTTLPIDRDAVCRELKFDDISRNSMDAVSDRDFIIELLSALAIFAMHVSRMSEDLILWSSREFDFIELGDAFCTGSSLMPQKKNPDIAELSRGKAARVYGALVALLTLCKGLPMTYNRDLQEDKEPVFDAIDTVKKILRVYPPMLASMAVKQEKMLAAANDPELMATDLAEALVEIGVPFRNAHHRVGAFVKWCKQHNKQLCDTTLEEMRQTIPEATPAFLEMFSPSKSVEKRETPGGTGPQSVDKQIRFWQKNLSL